MKKFLITEEQAQIILMAVQEIPGKFSFFSIKILTEQLEVYNEFALEAKTEN